MDTISYTALRNNLAAVLDKVNRDHAPILITRQNAEPAVLLSLEDFKSYEASAYLMASPQNAKRLGDSITQIEAGEAIIFELLEE